MEGARGALRGAPSPVEFFRKLLHDGGVPLREAERLERSKVRTMKTVAPQLPDTPPAKVPSQVQLLQAPNSWVTGPATRRAQKNPLDLDPGSQLP